MTMSVHDTERTKRAALAMSVDQGRSEVARTCFARATINSADISN
jgi:hypothetical protein